MVPCVVRYEVCCGENPPLSRNACTRASGCQDRTWERERERGGERESRVFTNGPGYLGSIPGRVIPKTLKMVLDTSLLNTQQYKVRIEVSAAIQEEK